MKVLLVVKLALVFPGVVPVVFTKYLYSFTPDPVSVEPVAAVWIVPVVLDPLTAPIFPPVGTVGEVLSIFTV